MKVRRLEIENFRSVAEGQIIFSDNTLLVGGNNVGKSTVCEALDLALGPERLYRRPVVDEHDFYGGRYVDDKEKSVHIRIRALLVDLSEEATTRFGEHLRLWDEAKQEFIDEEPGGADKADGPGITWTLPILFEARYDREEDDFIGETFFDHPATPDEDLDDEQRVALGQGRTMFSRAHKRYCGYIYLRALRTGSRALGLQRGSLLDTILRLGGEGAPEMWFDTLDKLRELDPAVGEIEQLQAIRTELRDRMGKFVALAPGDDSAAFFASDLTREHLREVVRLFIATSPSDHSVPFTRQGTGSINLLVFALLTLIAERKGNDSVIFAMEEPEIALPPHTQRRVTRFVRTEMGQAIVTSHSPYVIEQFEPEDIVMLNRDGPGKLRGTRPEPAGFKPKAYRAQRRQFAEAILARAVVVVEGSTEAALLPVASSILEQENADYTHFDLAGVSIFTADGDADVPRWAPIFKALDKQVFGFRDKQAAAPPADVQSQLDQFDKFWESPESGVEYLLVKHTDPLVHRRFLASIAERSDYPSGVATYDASASDSDAADLAVTVLKARKGEGFAYGALFVEQCQTVGELPEFLRSLLLEIDEALRPVMTVPGEPAAESDDTTSSEADEVTTPEPE
jgi:putative ATP-dependent endonuclease of the OLD family